METLLDEPAIELVRESKVGEIGLGERGLSEELGELAHVARLREEGDELGSELEVVVAGAARSGAAAHQARQRRERFDRRIDAGGVQLGGEHELSLGDVPGQVGDGVGDVATGHGEHRNLGDRPAAAADATAAFVDRGEVAVEVAGVAAPAGHLAACGGHLSDCLAVGGHVGHHDQHVSMRREREVFGDCQRDTRGDDAFDHGIVGGVEQQRELTGRGAFLEGVAHRGRVRVCDAHPGEDDRERFATGVGLRGDLGRELEVRQPTDREDAAASGRARGW